MLNKATSPSTWGVGTKITAFTFGLVGLILGGLIWMISSTTSNMLETRAQESVAHDLAGGDAAHGDLTLSRPEVLDRQASHVSRQIFECDRAGPLDVFLRLGVDGERHVLDRRIALGGGDDHVVDSGGLLVLGRGD